MSRHRADVSVVVPTRNRASLLGRTLASVLGQREVSVEVVVVDEASEDATAERVRALGDDRVTVIRNAQPIGVAAARNLGTAASISPWVAWCDDDDRWSPGKLAAQLHALRAAADGAQWAICGSVDVDDTGCVLRIDRPIASGDISAECLQGNVVPGGGSGVLASRRLFAATGGFDPALSVLADWDLWTRFALRSHVASVDGPHVAYLCHRDAMSRSAERVADELATICAAYAHERAVRGVAVDHSRWRAWATRQHVLAGRRWAALHGYARMGYEDRRPRHLAYAALSVLAPMTVRERVARPKSVDVAWLEPALAWLNDRANVLDER